MTTTYKTTPFGDVLLISTFYNNDTEPKHTLITMEEAEMAHKFIEDRNKAQS